ncbi:Rne/Rng family ribonuclease [Eisenibacter elegans]|uniref:Rne/Rng family ribonuclease n=1 Tax=Eisenibacter elegans TaxID=997 RepID=UPI00047D91FA|nr:Rne/Rng family ribonuclease [Eisenibacter elegans]
MSNELVINSTQQGERIVLLQDKNIVEYHLEERDNHFTVGDIYLGQVKKVVPGLNAAFIDIGYEKDAFLHYLDLGKEFGSLQKHVRETTSKKNNPLRKISTLTLEPQIDKKGKISQVLSRNHYVLVQVLKEPISTKGPRLSCEISLAGRYVVLQPFSNVVNISKKITSKDERTRLERLIASIKPNNFGVIVRTAAQGKDVAELDKDLSSLVEKWEAGMEALRTAKPRQKIIGEMRRASSILRDMLNESFDSIVVDDKQIYEETRAYIRTIAPDKERIVKLHSGKVKVFEHYGIEKQLKSLFGKSVSLPNGGYLIIEHTEALHVIDVNSGNKSNTEQDQESTALSVNLEAAREVARQLRVRDMGGIIIIDFIDMKKAEHKKQVYDFMKNEMKRDRSRATVLPLTKFGLMQITRQRVRPEMNIITREVCPTCNGTGSIQASILISDVIEGHLEHLFRKQNERGITVTLHPYLHAFFTKGIWSRQRQWLFMYGRWVKLIKDSSLPITSFHFLNKHGEEIELNN